MPPAAKAAGGEAMTVGCHVDGESSVSAAVDTVERAREPATVLVNSAGLDMNGVAARDMRLDQWRRLIATDLTGAVLASRRFAKGRGDGAGPAAILHISSVHAYAARAGGADCCAAKDGLTNLVETMAVEEARRGIRVDAIEPGMIPTPTDRRAENGAAYRRSLERSSPAGRAGRAYEVVDLAVFLASGKARYVAGARLVSDGGLPLMQALGA